MKFSQNEKIVLAVFATFGPQPMGNLLKIVYPGQDVYLSRQYQWMRRTIRKLVNDGLLTTTANGYQWQITGKGGTALYG